jgi:uncharacterized membrane protein
MERVYKFVITSIITGIFFLIPIGIIIIIFEKIFHLIEKLQIALHLSVTEVTYLHAFLNDLIVVFVILLLCFLAGLAAKLKRGKQLVKSIENNILIHLPGYDYTKSTAQGIFGISDHRFSDVVLYRDDTGKFAMAFKVEAITDIMIMIFIPSTPKAKDGEMLIVDKNRLTDTEITTKQAFALIRSIGSEAPALLGKYFDNKQSNLQNEKD